MSTDEITNLKKAREYALADIKLEAKKISKELSTKLCMTQTIKVIASFV